MVEKGNTVLVSGFNYFREAHHLECSVIVMVDPDILLELLWSLVVLCPSVSVFG